MHYRYPTPPVIVSTLAVPRLAWSRRRLFRAARPIALLPLLLVIACSRPAEAVGIAGCSLIILLVVFGAGVAVCAQRFDKVYRDAQNIVIEQHSNDLRCLTDESTEMAREAARAIEAARVALRDLRCQFIEIQKGR
jgi:hypothetical protein